MQARMQVVKIVDVMGWRAIGIKFTDYNKSVEMEWGDERFRKYIHSKRIVQLVIICFSNSKQGQIYLP